VRFSILLLDEPTSSLDAESETLIKEALDRLLHGRTCIIASHRLATIRDCDRILVIDRGRIAEDGTHTQLLSLGGIYARLAALQFPDHMDAGDWSRHAAVASGD
jgi:ATP-binding cassette, subfamily B, bacterial